MLNDQAANLVDRGSAMCSRQERRQWKQEQDPDIQTLSLKIKQAEAFFKG